jgi:putative GTP pyrophosphokinase
LLSKSQIDKIGDRLRQGSIDADAILALEAYRDEFTESYKYVERMFRDVLGHTVTGRPAKSTLAIIEKLRRQKTRLTQIQDIAGCRIVVGSVAEQNSLVEAAKVMLDDISVDDKRSDPVHGYRAVHLIIKQSGKLVEVQIRTRFQHLWAEISEKMADTYGHEIKYGEGNEWALNILRRMSEHIRKMEDLYLRSLKLERDISGVFDKRAMKLAKKRAEELQRAVRLEFYKLRELVRQIES